MASPRRCTCLLFALLVLTTPAVAQLRSLELYAPRSFGYVIGDTLGLTVDVVLDAPFTLDPSSLPRPRALNYWLDLTDVRLDDRGIVDGAHRYILDLTYQTFYAPLEPRRLDIPSLELAATDGQRQIELVVPAWSFLMSPLREIVSTTQGATVAPRPDVSPAPLATAGARRGLLFALGVALLALLVLAWQLGWGPFGRSRRRPFARAARAVSGSLPARIPAPTPAAYREALLALHRAFDATAGKGVFAEDLPDFFAEHPSFVAVESDVRWLFTVSRWTFFGEDPSAATREMPSAAIVALARRLRAVERGTA